MTERNVLGGELVVCGEDPMTGIYRDGTCAVGPDGVATHTVCVVVTAEFLAHQRSVGNDLLTPRPEYRFPSLRPGDRWCVAPSAGARPTRPAPRPPSSSPARTPGRST